MNASTPLLDSVFQSRHLADRLKTSAELSRTRHGVPTYLDFPCVIPFAFKRRLLNTLLRHHPPHVWNVSVQRSRLVLDIMERLSELTGARRISVTFAGEPAIDSGGVRREFFHNGARQFFSPEYSMFRVVKDGLFWFTDNSFEPMETYETIGRFVGLAVINGVTLPIRFPRLFYKKMLGIQVVVGDIRELDEDLEKNLSQTRAYRDDGNDVTDLGLVFAISQDQFGTSADIPFFQGGENVDVTNERLDEFLRYRTEFVLDGSVRSQFEAFQKGFRICCRHRLFTMFTPDELNLLVSGEPEYDWKELKASTTYRGYDAKSQIIVWFWRLFNELSQDEKKLVLLFSCGNDTVPIGGLKVLAFKIDKGTDPSHLPTSHTCFNTIVIPEYPNRAMLKEKLMIALANATGFAIK